MTTDIDRAFADRCATAATGLRQLAELGARPETDDAAVDRAAALTAELLADPEGLLAVALTVQQQQAAFSGRLLALWEGACETPPDVPDKDFTAWSGATKDLLIALGLEWDAVADCYIIKGGASMTGGPYRDPAPENPRLAETRRLRDKLRDIFCELPPVSRDDPRVKAVLAEIRAVWA